MPAAARNTMDGGRGSVNGLQQYDFFFFCDSHHRHDSVTIDFARTSFAGKFLTTHVRICCSKNLLW
jgi:hypothetical protein